MVSVLEGEKGRKNDAPVITEITARSVCFFSKHIHDAALVGHV